MLLSWRAIKERIRSVLHLDEEPWRIAAGMAVGVFISFTPFYGFHTVMALVCAFAFRLNKAATITGAWLNLPWFAPFVYGFAFEVGELILSGGRQGIGWGALAAVAQPYLKAVPDQEVARSLLNLLWQLMFVASKPLVVGTTVVGTVAGLAAYFITLEAVKDVRRLRARLHPPDPPAGEDPGSGRPADPLEPLTTESRRSQ